MGKEQKVPEARHHIGLWTSAIRHPAFIAGSKR